MRGDHTGDFGPHALRDLPGVRCRYVDGTLHEMRIAAPIVRAYSAIEGSRQLVGWRYRIEYSTAPSRWQEDQTSELQTALAADRHAAALSARRHPFVSVSWLRAYRVRIEMTWFAPDGETVSGRADHAVEWYRIVGVDGMEMAAHSVQGEFFGD
jgi:hypothetical protein